MTVLQISMDWRKPLLDYLKEGILPEKEVTRLKSRPARFALLDGILYKHSFSQPYLRCFSTEKARTILKKIHEGVCGSHIGEPPLGLPQERYLSMVYESEVVIPAEVGLETLRIQHYVQESNDNLLHANFDLVKEVREDA
ncbi:UNVERIFIED_CONTAM: hypothetical protein Scaly_1604000 [Sesamum calycinum]|uniref:Uncharacterized protein n=1 Tax=Sesamum calycinum TaxID=2727403 RepID=A0AAW2P9H0_9LAMI